jgi:tetratricopeptide (TPR) repeat protein
MEESNSKLQITANSYLIGSFTITPNGIIEDLCINEKSDIPQEVTEMFTKEFLNTSGQWDFPKLNKLYYYKTNFNALFTNLEHGNWHLFIHMNTNKPPVFVDYNTFLTQNRKADTFYNKGTRLLLKDNYEKAAFQFSNCIKLDSFYLDAHYNRAAANFKLNKTEAACQDWKLLFQLGQKEGERLYIENCKK